MPELPPGVVFQWRDAFAVTVHSHATRNEEIFAPIPDTISKHDSEKIFAISAIWDAREHFSIASRISGNGASRNTFHPRVELTRRTRVANADRALESYFGAEI